MDREAGRQPYLLGDGENIDATLGQSVLGRRPVPEERPRWDRVREFAASVWKQPVRALFFLHATSGQLPMPFISALPLDARQVAGALDQREAGAVHRVGDEFAVVGRGGLVVPAGDDQGGGLD